MIQVKSAKEIEIMKKANQIAADALIVAGNAITPGMSTWELDKIIHDFIVSRALSPHHSVTEALQAVPAFQSTPS